MSIALADFAPATQVEFAGSARPKVRTALLHCLVLAEDDDRRSMLSRAAEEAGWDVVLCRDAGQAAVEMRRHRYQLAIVDLEGADGFTPPEYREVSEYISQESGPLLMVCGVEGDALEEIWARQLGVWLYLPGVDETCDMSLMCSEAKRVTEKLRPELAAPQQQNKRLARTA